MPEGAPPECALLEVAALSAGYGTVPVLRDVALAVRPGEILLVAGENGAGKTTLLRTIGGLIRPGSGNVRLDGSEIAGRAPELIARAGLRLLLDGHRVFPDLSVLDNLRLGATLRFDRARFAQRLEEIFAVFPALRTRLRSRARDLSGGQQQMLALGQAFVAQPRVLLCDEPSTGIAMALVPPILGFLRDWAAQGVAIVVVEQHVRLALPYADRVMLLERGRVTFTGSVAAFAARSVAARAKPVRQAAS
jgi:branched-chain amino acid transport system ATP-binding protein